MSRDTASGTAAPAPGGENNFSALCSSLCAMDEGANYFPLRGRVSLRSRIVPRFQSDDFWFEQKAVREGEEGDKTLPTMHISFLTLAGAEGALPWWITEKIMHDASDGGRALHHFLDMLNRRFWELLFLKNCIGGDPRYSVHSPQQAQLLNYLSFALVGLEFPAGRRDAGGAGPELVRKLKQHCWITARGSAGPKPLAALLSHAFGCDVQIEENRLVRLPVAEKSRLSLGSGGQLSRSSGVLGKRALVHGAIRIRLLLTDAEALDEYLPSLRSVRLDLLRRILKIYYAQNTPRVALLLACPSGPQSATLGSRQCRIGWGAAFSTRGGCSQLLGVSALANSSSMTLPLETA